MVGVKHTGPILIRGARQLLTLRGPAGARRGPALNELTIIPDGALLIRDGILREIGPSRRVENLAEARGAVEINAAGRVVMPGFVDSHTHLVFPSPGNPAGELEIAARAVRTGTAKGLIARTRLHLHAMARHGTTTMEAKTGSGPDDRAEVKLLRVLAAFKKEPVDVVPTVLLRLSDGARPDEAAASAALEWYIRELLPKTRQRNRARFADLAWDTDPRLHPGFGRYLDEARKLGFGCKIHAQGERPAGAISMAANHLAASVDHLEHATNTDTTMMAESRAVATLLPYPNRGGRTAPVRALIDAGVPIALASDFHPRDCPNLNMQTVVALGCLQMGLTPAEAISAATINGAHALGCAGRAGSLETGKLADVLVLNTPDHREIAQHFGMNLVHLSLKRGECIYKEGDVAQRMVE